MPELLQTRLRCSSQSAVELSSQFCAQNLHTVDGRIPAPPRRPWNDNSPVFTSNYWFPIVSKRCRITSIHSRIEKGVRQRHMGVSQNGFQTPVWVICQKSKRFKPWPFFGIALPGWLYKRRDSQSAEHWLKAICSSIPILYEGSLNRLTIVAKACTLLVARHELAGQCLVCPRDEDFCGRLRAPDVTPAKMFPDQSLFPCA